MNVFALQASTEQMVLIARSHNGPQLVRDAGVRPGEVVAVDVSLAVRFNHQREVYWRPLVNIDLSSDKPPANVDVVVASVVHRQPEARLGRHHRGLGIRRRKPGADLGVVASGRAVTTCPPAPTCTPRTASLPKCEPYR